MTGSRIRLLTGPPGIGKTTAMRRIVAALARRKIGGFTTGEIREKGERVGFGLESFDGARAVLAHVGIASSHRISRYGVDLGPLETFLNWGLIPLLLTRHGVQPLLRPCLWHGRLRDNGLLQRRR